MRKLLTITLALTMCAGAAMASHIGIFSDPAGSSCIMSPPAFGLVNLYVVQKLNLGSTAVKFKVTDTLGWTPLSQTPAPGYLVISPQGWFVDVEVAFACVVDEHLLGTLGYFYQGTPITCANGISIDPAPTSPIPGQVVAVDCNTPFGNIVPASGGRLYANETCNCRIATAASGCGCVATAESTWGSIKALYR